MAAGKHKSCDRQEEKDLKVDRSRRHQKVKKQQEQENQLNTGPIGQLLLGEMKMKRSIFFAVVILIAATAASAAVQSTATINVSAQVIGSCKWTTPLTFDFGSYDPFATSDLTKTGVDISFKCVKATASGDVYKVSFTKSSGNLSNGATPADLLPYFLYKGGTTTPLPGTGAGDTVGGTAGIGGGYTYTIDGAITKNQDVPVGTYSDTVTAQIEY